MDAPEEARRKARREALWALRAEAWKSATEALAMLCAAYPDDAGSEGQRKASEMVALTRDYMQKVEQGALLD